MAANSHAWAKYHCSIRFEAWLMNLRGGVPSLGLPLEQPQLPETKRPCLQHKVTVGLSATLAALHQAYIAPQRKSGTLPIFSAHILCWHWFCGYVIFSCMQLCWWRFKLRESESLWQGLTKSTTRSIIRSSMLPIVANNKQLRHKHHRLLEFLLLLKALREERQ